ncbi:hypothetical protein VSX61_22140 [Brenneria populi subsp. brevivirga]|uniref:hypothetical protein n=1 Tax=Brenneria populi TaxID=1505588 RepID=UPI002E16C979|nr:hypothetical protein [Brenneria populi subsp. brevivirga]
MKNIGFHGGHTVYENGISSDMFAFFQCIDHLAKLNYPQKDFCLLTDRLYRRYLKHNELASAEELMSSIEMIFKETPCDKIKWEEIGLNVNSTGLDLNQPTLDQIFKEYFLHFIDAKNSAEEFFKKFGIYQPVKTVISDLPWFIEDKNRPLEQYDALGPNDPPFWLR